MMTLVERHTTRIKRVAAIPLGLRIDALSGSSHNIGRTIRLD